MTKTQKFSKRRNYAVQIKDVIPRIAKNINGKDSINMCLNWQKIVGDEYAKYLTPVRIMNQNDKITLLLKCVSGAELTMNYAQNEIMERINRYMGNKKINKIKLVPQNKKPIFEKAIKKDNSKDNIEYQKALQSLAESL